jgi:uncharacterized membrane protein
MLDLLTRTFLRGLAVTLPLALTLALVIWMGLGAESLFGAPIRAVLPPGWYIPGMGLVAGFALVFAAGMLVNVWAMRRVERMIDNFIKRIPLINSFYSGMKDLFGFFGGKPDGRKAKRVVLVSLPGTEVRLVGLLTRDTVSEFPKVYSEGEEPVAVYLQMSYQLGGYTVLLPKKLVEEVDMSVEEAARFVLTAGISGK